MHTDGCNAVPARRERWNAVMTGPHILSDDRAMRAGIVHAAMRIGWGNRHDCAVHATSRKGTARPSARALVSRLRGRLGALLVLRHAGAARALPHPVSVAARERRA